MHEYINRFIEGELADCLASFPAVAVLGPRQCGKTTLALSFKGEFSDIHHFDLEDPSDLERLDNPKLALQNIKGLIVIDEIQRKPDLFPVFRILPVA